MINIRWQI